MGCIIKRGILPVFFLVVFSVFASGNVVWQCTKTSCSGSPSSCACNTEDRLTLLQATGAATYYFTMKGYFLSCSHENDENDFGLRFHATTGGDSSAIKVKSLSDGALLTSQVASRAIGPKWADVHLPTGWYSIEIEAYDDRARGNLNLDYYLSPISRDIPRNTFTELVADTNSPIVMFVPTQGDIPAESVDDLCREYTCSKNPTASICFDDHDDSETKCITDGFGWRWAEGDNRCCGDDATDIGLVADDKLCKLVADGPAWYDGVEGEVVTLGEGSDASHYLKSGSQWHICTDTTTATGAEPMDSVISAGDNDYLCYSSGDVRQIAKCCGSENCEEPYSKGTGEFISYSPVGSSPQAITYCTQDKKWATEGGFCSSGQHMSAAPIRLNDGSSPIASEGGKYYRLLATTVDSPEEGTTDPVLYIHQKDDSSGIGEGLPFFDSSVDSVFLTYQATDGIELACEGCTIEHAAVYPASCCLSNQCWDGAECQSTGEFTEGGMFQCSSGEWNARSERHHYLGKSAQDILSSGYCAANQCWLGDSNNDGDAADSGEGCVAAGTRVYAGGAQYSSQLITLYYCSGNPEADNWVAVGDTQTGNICRDYALSSGATSASFFLADGSDGDERGFVEHICTEPNKDEEGQPAGNGGYGTWITESDTIYGYDGNYFVCGEGSVQSLSTHGFHGALQLSACELPSNLIMNGGFEGAGGATGAIIVSAAGEAALKGFVPQGERAARVANQLQTTASVPACSDNGCSNTAKYFLQFWYKGQLSEDDVSVKYGGNDKISSNGNYPQDLEAAQGPNGWKLYTTGVKGIAGSGRQAYDITLQKPDGSSLYVDQLMFTEFDGTEPSLPLSNQEYCNGDSFNAEAAGSADSPVTLYTSQKRLVDAEGVTIDAGIGSSPSSCCPATHCWDGQDCVDGTAGDLDNYVCDNGAWVTTQRTKALALQMLASAGDGDFVLHCGTAADVLNSPQPRIEDITGNFCVLRKGGDSSPPESDVLVGTSIPGSAELDNVASAFVDGASCAQPAIEEGKKFGKCYDSEGSQVDNLWYAPQERLLIYGDIDDTSILRGFTSFIEGVFGRWFGSRANGNAPIITSVATEDFEELYIAIQNGRRIAGFKDSTSMSISYCGFSAVCGAIAASGGGIPCTASDDAPEVDTVSVMKSAVSGSAWNEYVWLWDDLTSKLRVSGETSADCTYAFGVGVTPAIQVLSGNTAYEDNPYALRFQFTNFYTGEAWYQVMLGEEEIGSGSITQDEGGVIAAGAQEFSLDEPSTFTITASYLGDVDAQGIPPEAIVTHEHIVTVLPIPAFSVSLGEGRSIHAGNPVTFIAGIDGGLPEDSQLSFAWELDAIPLDCTGESCTITAEDYGGEPGTYEVMATATMSSGSLNSQIIEEGSASFEATNNAPSITGVAPVPPIGAHIGGQVQLSVMTSDADSDTVSCKWETGPDTGVYGSPGACTMSYTFTSIGTKVIRVKATDGYSESASYPIAIEVIENIIVEVIDEEDIEDTDEAIPAVSFSWAARIKNSNQRWLKTHSLNVNDRSLHDMLYRAPSTVTPTNNSLSANQAINHYVFRGPYTNGITACGDKGSCYGQAGSCSTQPGASYCIDAGILATFVYAPVAGSSLMLRGAVTATPTRGYVVSLNGVNKGCLDNTPCTIPLEEGWNWLRVDYTSYHAQTGTAGIQLSFGIPDGALTYFDAACSIDDLATATESESISQEDFDEQWETMGQVNDCLKNAGHNNLEWFITPASSGVLLQITIDGEVQACLDTNGDGDCGVSS